MSDELNAVHEALKEIKSVVSEKTKDLITKDKFDKVSEALISLQEKSQQQEQESLAFKAALQASGVHENKSGLNDTEKKHSDLAEAWMRSGSEVELKSAQNAIDLEQKALGVYSGANGGYTVPKLMSAKILQRIFETSPIRTVASVESISSDNISFLLDDQEMSSGWTTETAARTETGTAKFGKRTIIAHEQYAKPKATQQLLEDSSYNIEAWIAQKVSDKLGREENSAFVNGDGVSKPRGLLTYTAGTAAYNREQVEQFNLGAAAAITGAGLIGLQNALKSPFQARAVWLMNRTTYGKVTQLMYADNKFNALTPLSINGNALTLLGKKIVLADDIPEVAANALSIVYGDLSLGYQIVDRVGITMLRDPYSDKPNVEFYFRKRVGGDVLNTESFKIGKIAS